MVIFIHTFITANIKWPKHRHPFTIASQTLIPTYWLLVLYNTYRSEHKQVQTKRNLKKLTSPAVSQSSILVGSPSTCTTTVNKQEAIKTPLPGDTHWSIKPRKNPRNNNHENELLGGCRRVLISLKRGRSFQTPSGSKILIEHVLVNSEHLSGTEIGKTNTQKHEFA